MQNTQSVDLFLKIASLWAFLLKNCGNYGEDVLDY